MGDWSPYEVDLIIADYFSMLSEELAGKHYSKTEHRKRLVPLLNNRGAAVEYKHQNISAVLMKLGLPFIKGYKPLNNYQGLLVQKIIDYVALNRGSLEPKFMQFAESSHIILQQPSFENFVESPPERQIQHLTGDSEVEYKRKPVAG
jgi:hypothetical protein